MQLKLLQKRASQKSADDWAGDLICNKITEKITKASKTLQQNNSGAVKSGRKRFMFPEKDQKLLMI